jgi:V/A-type H+-transporting ATPase subunit D
VSAVRHPPGRSGRLWLERRLAVARRAADLLDRKRQALISETERMRVLSERAQRNWGAAMGETRSWAARAAALTGEEQGEELTAHLGGHAAARVGWRSIMGVAYPAEVSIELPAGTAAPLAGTAAYDELEGAARRALAAALESAAATRAYALLRDELAHTARRQRLIDKRRVPDLAEQLRSLEQRLEEQERDEGVRVRWVARRARAGVGGGA